jgi:hypothetical protein
MEILLKDFLTDQIFGLSGLANLANFAVLLAFSVRDVLKLRILSLVADVVILPYYYFSTNRFGRQSSGESHSSSSTGFGS